FSKRHSSRLCFQIIEQFDRKCYVKDTVRQFAFINIARSTKRIRKNIRDAKENVKNIKNPYEPLTTLPLQDTQSTIMQSYSRNDYIHPLPSVLQSIQTSIDSSYILSPTNLPISFPSTVPYYSNSTVPSNNCPPDQNPYSLSPAYLFNSSSFATSHNSSITASSTLNFSS
ncbi:2278_t:CDS:2, partial [Rhizophagus irregularis]